MARIAVIGAGIAGLACAWRLQRAGHAVDVFEREPAPGGRMRSERRGEFVVDRGAQFIASGYRNLHALARELGLEEKVHPVARSSNAMLRGGELLPGDWGSPGAFLGSRLLSARAKLRLARLPLELWRHRKVLDPLRPERAAELDREDLATWARRTVGEENLEYLLGPALSLDLRQRPRAPLAARSRCSRMRFVTSGFRLQCFEGGIGLLTRTLAERLTVRLGWT